jgi:beta-N-acetylhexosaminidase
MSDRLERLAAACLLPSFPGFEAPGWMLRRLEAGLGGVCLFAYNVGDRAQLAALTASLRDAGGEPLLAIDEEGGDVTRLEAARGSSYPGNAALGVVDDLELTGRVAASIGAELAAVGINLDFAPVADVNLDLSNPVIGIRSFGSDPALVAGHVAAFVTGLQSAGVAACAKHFPGHGATSQDSHLELAVVTGDPEPGLEPFRAAIAAGVQTIMTAHVLVPGLDDAPATLSPRIVTDLLRGRLGFDGLVIADALEMRALSATIGVERSAVLALGAGVDALLIGHDLGEDAVAAVQAALVEAVVSGELAEERLHEAAGRVARVAAWAASAQRSASVDEEAGRAAAERALHVEGGPRLTAAPIVVELRPRANIAAGEAAHSLGDVLAARLPGTESIVLDETAPAPARLGSRPLVLAVRDAHRHAWMRDAAATLLTEAPEAVVVELGLPIWRPDGAAAYVATYGGSRASYEALSRLLLASYNGTGVHR